MTEEDLSRALNAFTGGDPAELFCARLWRNRWSRWCWLVWPLIGYVDWRCHKLYGERGHCRRVAREQQLDERFRWAQE